MKKILLLFSALLLSFHLAGCQKIGEDSSSSEPEPVQYPVEVGQQVFQQAPQTAASLSPALTEIICELGYTDRLVAKSQYCDYPPEIAGLSSVGSSANPDIDKIIETAPELLLSQSPIAKKDITKIENAGIRVLILSAPASLPELEQCYTGIAGLFGGAANALDAAAAALSPLNEALGKAVPSGSFAYIMTNDLAVATGDTLAGDILSRFGSNIARDNQKYNVTAEELLQNQPDTLFLAQPLTAENLPAETAGLNAVAGGKIIPIDNTCFERPTVRLLTSLVDSIQASLGASAAVETTADAAQ